MPFFRLMAEAEELHFCPWDPAGNGKVMEEEVSTFVWWQATPPALSSPLRCHVCQEEPSDNSENSQLFIFNLLVSLPCSFLCFCFWPDFLPPSSTFVQDYFPPDRSGCIFSSSVLFVTTQGVTLLWWLWGQPTLAVVAAESEGKSAKSSSSSGGGAVGGSLGSSLDLSPLVCSTGR